MTQSSRSRKEQRKGLLERQCVASNSLARTPPPESASTSTSTLKPYLLTNTQTNPPPVSPKGHSTRQKDPPQPDPGQTGP